MMTKLSVYFLTILLFSRLLFPSAKPHDDVEIFVIQSSCSIHLSIENYKERDGFTPVVLSFGKIEINLWMDEKGRVFEMTEGKFPYHESLFTLDPGSERIIVGNQSMAAEMYEANQIRTRLRFSERNLPIRLKVGSRENDVSLFLGDTRLDMFWVSAKTSEVSPGLKELRLSGIAIQPHSRLIFKKAEGNFYNFYEEEKPAPPVQRQQQAKPANSLTAIPTHERIALIALYNSTNGDNWANNSGWKTPPIHTDGFAMPGTEGTWFGITITDNHVTVIELWIQSLKGSIPHELGNLSELQELILGRNQITGNIPSELGALNNLRRLILTNNHLSGNIPAELGNLINLTYFSLSSNQLDGSIPPELGNLRNLKHLVLHINQLTGIIPPELANLSKLESLGLNGNQLTGNIPPEFENLTNIIVLGLGSNHLTGSIPPEIGNLISLDRLNLSQNQLSGSIPKELGNLTKMTYLNIVDNQISGVIPPEFGNLSNLETLGLYENQLIGSIPRELGNLAKLNYFGLHKNQFTGAIPPELGNLSNLRHLYLNNNNLIGPIPSELGDMNALIQLLLHKNNITGIIPPSLGNLTYLQDLNLSYNQLSGPIPIELKNLTNIDTLWLSFNQLSGNIPPELGNLANMRLLTLAQNQLSGDIPVELGNLIRLFYLDLSFNQLDSSIPNELGSLTNLIRFYLNNNYLSGEIPKSLINLNKLITIYIRYNCLYTNDAELKAWLDSYDPFWEIYQNNCPTTPTITVSTPNGGESWTAGSTNNITWSSEGDVGNVKVKYTIDGGANWITIVPTVPNDGISPWTIPNTPSTNCKVRISEALDGEPADESDSTFSIVPPPRILYVNSTPVTDVNINISPVDLNGQGSGSTNFSRSYASGTTVTLNAPAFSFGRSFLKWLVDNSDNNNQSITVTMDSDHTVVAVYEEEATTYTLNVQSSHGQGAGITVTPDDINGNGDGFTHFERTFYKGTIVTLTAPSSHHKGKVFDHWKIDGVQKIKDLSIQVSMDRNHKAKAYYRDPKSKK